MRAGRQPSAAPQQLSHQKGIAPKIEVPQLELDKQRASAQGAGKFLCCRSVTHLIGSSVVSHICNLCAMHWRSSSCMVVFVAATAGTLRLAAGQVGSKLNTC